MANQIISGIKNMFSRPTVGAKIISLITILLLTSVVILVLTSTHLFVDDNRALIQKMTSDSALTVSNQLRETLESLRDGLRSLGPVLVKKDTAAVKEFFKTNADIRGIQLLQHGSGDTANVVFTAFNSADDEKLARISDVPYFSIGGLSQGELQLGWSKLTGDSRVVVLGIPYLRSSDGTFSIVAYLAPDRFQQAFSGNDSVVSYLADARGRILLHSDMEIAAEGTMIQKIGIFEMASTSKINNGQTLFVDPTNKISYLGAFRWTGLSGLIVFAQIPESKAFEAARKVVYRSFLIAIMIMSIAFGVGSFFSKTLTNPLRDLADAAMNIAKGDFKVRVKKTTRDEIGDLSQTFNEMAEGLEERERVKEVFNKFHSKEIASKLLSGEVKLGGEKKNAVVFFSDIRGFTGISESMTPEEVVEMLNEYMTRMVAVIQKNHGVVDKYVGDAIMALWGVPFSNGEEDIKNALQACIQMRMELAALNELRISRGQFPLKIGMGLNYGEVIAGNIGSNEKMEYTVIGDTVNLASRVESMTKEFGTDLLVSQSLEEKARKEFMFEPCVPIKVKGKTEPVQLFRVPGIIDENGTVWKMETAYSSYKAEHSDKAAKDDKKEAA